MEHFGSRAPTVLIVEDIDWIRSGMRRSVERCGYRAVEAADAAGAVEAAARESPDLILTEEELPTFDELLARLRERPELRHVPVVIVNPDAEEGARHGDALILGGYEQLAPMLVRGGETSGTA